MPTSGDLNAVTGTSDTTPTTTVAVPVVVNGPLGNSAMTFDPTFYSFPTLATNAGSATKSFTVTNSSAYNIFLGTITGANSQFSLTANTCTDGLALAKGATCAFTVRFAPATSGILSTAFSIPYDVTPGTNGFSSNLGVSGAGTTLTSFAGLDSLSGETPTTIKLNWTDFAGAATYQVYRVSDGVPTLIGTVISANLASGLGCATGACSYTASGLSPLTSYAFRVRATDFYSVQELNIRNLTSTTTAGFLNLTGATSVGAGVCTALTVSIQDATPALVNVGADTTIAMTGLGSGAIYSDAGCTTPLANPVIAAGTSSKIFYFKDNTPQSLTLIGSLTSFTNATKSFTVIPKLAFTTQPSATGNTDTVLAAQPVVTVQDGTGATVTSATHSITLTAYSDTVCAVPVTGGVTATANPLAATSGVATFAGVKILKSNTIRIGASGTSLASACSAAVIISAGAVVAANSTVTWVPASLIANNVATSAITVTLKDANGNGVPGKTVTATSDRGTDTISGSGGSTNSSGVVNLTARSSSTGESTITVVGNGSTLNQTAKIIFLSATPLTDYQAKLFDGLNPGSNSSSLKSIWKDLARSATTYDGSLVNFLFDGTSGWSAKTYRDEVLADSPVGYWRLNETAGTTASDSSGSGNDGTYVNSPTLSQFGALSGDSDSAVLFTQASSQYVVVPNHANLNITGAVTLEAWVYPAQNAFMGVIDMAQEGTSIENYSLLLTNHTSPPRMYFQYNNGGGWNSISFDNFYTLNTWQHVAVTYNAGTITAYKNGVQFGNPVTGQAALPTNTSNALKIGRYQVGGQGYWDGKIDEVAIYNTALSASRIAAHYNTGARPDRSLVFDGSTSNSYVDFGTGVNNNANFSFETWFKPTSAAATGKVILSNGTTTNSGASNETNTGLTLRQSKTRAGKLELYLGESGEKAYAQEVLADSPVGYWKLNETSGTSASDSSGNTQTGSYFGTPTLGQAGPYSTYDSNDRSALLNGTSQYISIPNNPITQISGSFSVTAWINTAAAAVNYGKYILQSESSAGAAGAHYPGIEFSAADTRGGVNGGLRCRVTYDWTAVLAEGYSTSAVNDGNWHMVGCTYDGATIRLYVDGVLNGSAAYSGGIQTFTGDPIYIGGVPGPGYYFPGWLAEVALFNQKLSDARILAHYNAALKKKTCTSTSTFADNVWHFISGVFDSTGPTLKLFVDGTQECSITNAGTAFTGSTNPLRAGRDSSASNSWAGQIADLRTYNSSLTSSDVVNNRLASLSRFPDAPSLIPGLILWLDASDPNTLYQSVDCASTPVTTNGQSVA